MSSLISSGPDGSSLQAPLRQALPRQAFLQEVRKGDLGEGGGVHNARQALLLQTLLRALLQIFLWIYGLNGGGKVLLYMELKGRSRCDIQALGKVVLLDCILNFKTEL